ncbi:L-aspartate oxidase [Ruegeria sp. Ofav3-42]|uniref:L-aspartate oxidase n=1 Tax=Ruegeria sp. Ofav3-42 TaxID=2917759 RepID=UPI001EF7450E|nr:L-aspartate oxidase [Ruegeria sp. Ofav3-42]MCG7521371.1 L-aspartate oxidase [Ruegeria sp. Ofav3-42]
MIRLEGLHGQTVIVGSGIAGLVAALEMAPQPVVLITRAGLGQECSSAWAQGGIAAALEADDSPAQHLADTLRAGDGLCDETVASGILSEAQEAIALLESYGVRFDRTADGVFSLGREAAHSHRRILHVGGDRTGSSITSTLTRAVPQCPSITCLTDINAQRLVTTDGHITGIQLQKNDYAEVLRTAQVIIATGGCGGLYDASTNPSGNFGQGVMMAARAGAALRDMEFMQFHPTALDTPQTPMALVSEAVRGEGAILIDQTGRRFMAQVPGAELAPRDVVARAVHQIISRGGRAFLDARATIGSDFAQNFPGIHALCAISGVDPARDPIPIRPVAHYHMGGIATDKDGRSTLHGLWAIGECAATGLHGANRLASNSLLETVVMGRRAARDVAGRGMRTLPTAPKSDLLPDNDLGPVRPVVSKYLGVVRNEMGLRCAISKLLPLVETYGRGSDPALVALAIAVFANLRCESRGGHYRSDFPDPSSQSQSYLMTLTEILAHAGSARQDPLLRTA